MKPQDLDQKENVSIYTSTGQEGKEVYWFGFQNNGNKSVRVKEESEYYWTRPNVVRTQLYCTEGVYSYI